MQIIKLYLRKLIYEIKSKIVIYLRLKEIFYRLLVTDFVDFAFLIFFFNLCKSPIKEL